MSPLPSVEVSTQLRASSSCWTTQLSPISLMGSTVLGLRCHQCRPQQSTDPCLLMPLGSVLPRSLSGRPLVGKPWGRRGRPRCWEHLHGALPDMLKCWGSGSSAPSCALQQTGLALLSMQVQGVQTWLWSLKVSPVCLRTSSTKALVPQRLGDRNRRA